MLLNTLSVIEMTIRQKLNKDTEVKEMLAFFRNYKKNMWLYPGTLKRKFFLTAPEVYDFLSELEKKGILQSYYEMYCSNCQKSMGTVQLFNELPETFECELCHEELPTLENTVLIYLVVRDD